MLVTQGAKLAGKISVVTVSQLATCVSWLVIREGKEKGHGIPVSTTETGVAGHLDALGALGQIQGASEGRRLVARLGALACLEGR